MSKDVLVFEKAYEGTRFEKIIVYRWSGKWFLSKAATISDLHKVIKNHPLDYPPTRYWSEKTITSQELNSARTLAVATSKTIDHCTFSRMTPRLKHYHVKDDQ